MKKHKSEVKQNDSLGTKLRKIEEIKKLYESLRAEMRNQWNRDLPLEELLFDRWERAERLGFGKGTSIYHNSYVYGDVKVGRNTWIGPFTVLDGSGGLKIGSHCSISAGVQIYTHDTVQWAITGGKSAYDFAPVRIGDYCYLGPNVVVSKGIKIGARSIVGANSVVFCDVPSRSKFVGCPARAVSDNQGK
jgi:acetyltransferase-like isoleucine patch superfamily enzyme